MPSARNSTRGRPRRRACPRPDGSGGHPRAGLAPVGLWRRAIIGDAPLGRVRDPDAHRAFDLVRRMYLPRVTFLVVYGHRRGESRGEQHLDGPMELSFRPHADGSSAIGLATGATRGRTARAEPRWRQWMRAGAWPRSRSRASRRRSPSSVRKACRRLCGGGRAGGAHGAVWPGRVRRPRVGHCPRGTPGLLHSTGRPDSRPSGVRTNARPSRTTMGPRTWRA